MPISDDNSDRVRTPFVNYALIAINVFVFIVLQAGGENDDFTYKYSMVPKEIVTGKDVVTEDEPVQIGSGPTMMRPGLRPTPLPELRLTLWTSIFMHGSLMHLLGNMLFLWIFGDNLEDRLGHVRYLIFYLVCGLVASLSHVALTYALNKDPLTPCLGASGAISGVMGGYMVLFPQRRVTVIMFRMLTQVPAIVAVGLWFVLQLISSIGMLGPGSGGGVAYAAHIGGFIAGAILIKPLLFGSTPPHPAAPPRYAPQYRRRF
jgi:membrane associated rhomboid family serine protease